MAFTRSGLENVVRIIASRRPETRYLDLRVSYHTGRCSDSTEGTLIGQALRTLGYVVPPRMAGWTIGEVLEEELRQDCPAGGWLGTVQRYSDSGSSWGLAVSAADAVEILLKQQGKYVAPSDYFAVR